MISIEKIVHKGEQRIKIDAPFEPTCIDKIKQVPGRTFSASLHCWHVPYNTQTYQQLKSLFPDLIVVANECPPKKPDGLNPPAYSSNANIAGPESPEKDKAEKQEYTPRLNLLNAAGTVRMEVRGRSVFVFLPKNESDILFLRSFSYYQWLPKERCWQLPAYPGNLRKLHAYFGERLHSITTWPIPTPAMKDVVPLPDGRTWICIQKLNGRVCVRSQYNAALVFFLKKQPYPAFNRMENTWTIAWYDGLREAFENLAQQQDKKLVWETERKQNKGLPRPPLKKMAGYKPCPPEYTAKMKQLNYTESSIKNYVSLFEEFINYHENTEPADITPEMIERYMQYLVMERKFGTSSHRIAISAIKFYYEKVLHQPKHRYFFEQPQSEKKLPVVLNKQEVEKMLTLTGNLKHKTLLTLAYSSGLRVSEVVGLKVSDIDLERGTIHIREGKGLKDRYSFLAKKARIVIEAYLQQYQPKQYLFEGEGNEMYSQRSAQLVFHHAVQRAGIQKEVKFHTLRHSFATHALENGTNLRVIQEILGHNSSRTTEIYTHVTQKTLHEFRNPLDLF